MSYMSKSKKTVMIFGTFDFFHAGHLSFLTQARAYGERLIAVVARDKTVKMVKGEKPFHGEKERVNILRHIDLIDEVIMGNERDMYAVIRRQKPNVIVLGYDQKAFTDNLKKIIIKFALKIKIARAKPYRPKSRKSGLIRKKLDL